MSGGGFGATKAALHRADSGFGRARTVHIAAGTAKHNPRAQHPGKPGRFSIKRIGDAFVRGVKDGTVGPVKAIRQRAVFLAGMPARLGRAASTRGMAGVERQLFKEARAEADYEAAELKGLAHTGYIGLEMSPLGAPIIQRQIQRNGVARTLERLTYDGATQIPATAAMVGTGGVASRVSAFRAAAEIASIPRGFPSFAEYARFGSRLKSGLAEAGFGDTEAAVQGSGATGQSFRTGEAFDVGRTSDFDVALGGDKIMDAARATGAELRTRGTRTGPLTKADVEALGLSDLQAELSAVAGRDVKFMVYRSIDAALTRRPGIMIP